MVRRSSPIRPLAVAIVLLAFAAPVSADITVTGHYVFMDGDTATRSTPYTTKRGRLTLPDGREMIYDTKQARVTMIDHDSKTYWTAPAAEADSIAAQRLLEMRKELQPLVEQNREAWMKQVQVIGDSIKVKYTGDMRDIAGYTCTKWVLTVGDRLRHERWVTPALGVADYAPEMEQVALASIADPLGRLFFREVVKLRGKTGLALASTTTFETITQKGSFSFEATGVSSAKVPGTAWDLPKGYTKVKLKP